jgi:regulatory protein YycI of two-component signal transduction system YycFG
MKKKISISIILFLNIYLASYFVFRQTNSELWEKDKNTWVIFPEDKILYDIYRPQSFGDGRITGMRFHIGDRQ